MYLCTECNIERRKSEVIRDSEGEKRCPYCLEIVKPETNDSDKGHDILNSHTSSFCDNTIAAMQES